MSKLDKARAGEDAEDRMPLREALPKVAGKLAELVADNPASTALTVAGVIVLARLIVRAVQPETITEGLACMLLTPAAGNWLFLKAVDAGVIDFTFRVEGEQVALSEMRAAVRAEAVSGADRGV